MLPRVPEVFSRVLRGALSAEGENTSGETGNRKPETAHEKPLASRVAQYGLNQ